MRFQGTLREGLYLIPALASTRLNVPRRDGVRRLGHLSFRFRRFCYSVPPRSELLVQFVGFLHVTLWVSHPISIAQW